MEKLKQIAEAHSDKLKYLFLGGAAIGLINTFCRADYNFVIYLYMYYVWTNLTDDKISQNKEKITFFYITLYSLIIDFIWVLFWDNKWELLKEDIESGTHGLVVFLSWVGILLKLVVCFLIGLSEWSSLKGTLPKALGDKLSPEYMQQVDDGINY